MAHGEVPVPEREVTEVEFRLPDRDYFFVELSREDNCRADLAEVHPREDGRYAEIFSVVDVSPDRVLSRVEARPSIEARLLAEYDDDGGGGLFEFLVTDDCPIVTLTDEGALPRTVSATDGTGRIVAEVPPREDPGQIVESFLEKHERCEFAGKREKERFDPLFEGEALQRILSDRLTDRQYTVLRAAYDAGYYEWPRECTGEELADDLDIASATFSQHIHAAERNLLSALFEGASGDE